jgi:hypothetical protein
MSQVTKLREIALIERGWDNLQDVFAAVKPAA